MPRNASSGCALANLEMNFAGRFRILRLLADGASATVFEAEQLGPAGFAKRVALKVVHRQTPGTQDSAPSLVTDLSLSANLVHGNIVQIFQLGELAGEYFVAMEFVKGPTVRRLIERQREFGRPLPPTLAAYIASRVARALHFAHNFVDPARGARLDIVHRNVSPGNVLTSWDGHVKLSGFGVAGARDVGPASRTQYRSPEQLLGTRLGPRSDIYSLGVVLFELLGLDREVVDGTSASAEHLAHPQLSARLQTLDPSLEHILRRALEHDPSRRPSALVLGTDLDRWIATQHTHGTAERLQAHLSHLFPREFSSSTKREEEGVIADFSALERAVRHTNGRARLLERWFGS